MNWTTICGVCFITSSLVLISSCTHLEFAANGITPFNISAGPGSERIQEIEGTGDFYFWGKSPPKFKVDLEDMAQNLGLNEPSYVSVEQYIGFKSFMFTTFTLGVYCPVDYRIKVLTKDSGHL